MNVEIIQTTAALLQHARIVLAVIIVLVTVGTLELVSSVKVDPREKGEKQGGGGRGAGRYNCTYSHL
jgi:hypothetical protein